jgi:hypothetical protein
MSQNSTCRPSKLVVQYDDGSSREVDYSKVDGETRYLLQKLGLAPTGERVGAAKHYLLLRWKDGWQEVLGVDKDSMDLLRYYVIERVDDRGRLSLDLGEGYPELLVIERTPRDLVGALIVGSDEVKVYPLEESVERWEGIFEAGGKREHVKFDKTSDKYPHEMATGVDALDPVLLALKDELEKAGLRPAALLALDEPERVAAYKGLASGAGIRGCSRQEDVYGFVEAMINRLGGAG